MPASSCELLTIGYEGTTLPVVIAALRAARVSRLLDIRAIAQSRKPGFSKTLLSATLAVAGIDYVHLRGLGTPKGGRQAARRGDTATMRAIFAEHMRTGPAQADLAVATGIAQADRCCLLCFERDHTGCHRAIVAGLICEATGIVPGHLVPGVPGPLAPGPTSDVDGAAVA